MKYRSLLMKKYVHNAFKLINNEGENLGVITRDEALKLARTAELDLVMVSDTGRMVYQ